jgi:hypothetical protein
MYNQFLTSLVSLRYYLFSVLYILIEFIYTYVDTPIPEPAAKYLSVENYRHIYFHCLVHNSMS